MSNEAITWAFKLDVRPAGRKFILVTLADHADERDSCFPGVERLAKMTGQSDKSVRDHLKGLEADGLLSRHRDRRTDGTLTGYRYILPVDSYVGKISQINLRRASGEDKHKGKISPVDHRQISPSPPADSSITTGEICRSITPKYNPQEEPLGFVDFWEACSRKVDRKKATAAYSKALKTTDPETLLAGIKRYTDWCKCKPVTEPQFIKHPTTWLNGECWSDELPPKAGKSAPVLVDDGLVTIRHGTANHKSWGQHYAEKAKLTGARADLFKADQYNLDKDGREVSLWPPDSSDSEKRKPAKEAAE